MLNDKTKKREQEGQNIRTQSVDPNIADSNNDIDNILQY